MYDDAIGSDVLNLGAYSQSTIRNLPF